MKFKELMEKYPEIANNYLDFEVDWASFYPDDTVSFAITGDLAKDKCDCYRVSKERHYLTVIMRQFIINLLQNMKLNTMASVMVQKTEKPVIVAVIGVSVILRGKL